MPQITVYHNPNFLYYRGDHSQIAPPTQPVAVVAVPKNLPPMETLSIGCAKTQHLDDAWFNNTGVAPCLRSASPGDLITLPDGSFYVVETMGFQPYRPKAIAPVHKLVEAYRLLETAVGEEAANTLPETIQKAMDAIQYALNAEGYPESESPMLWEKAKVGDLVGVPEMGTLRVIARKLRPKWRAKRVLASIPDAQIWIDSPQTWAVLVPVNEEDES